MDAPLELTRVKKRCDRCQDTDGVYDNCENGCLENLCALFSEQIVVRREDDVIIELQRQVHNLKGDLWQMQDSNKTLEQALAIERHERVEMEKKLRAQLFAEREDAEKTLSAKDALINAWHATSTKQLALIDAINETRALAATK